MKCNINNLYVGELYLTEILENRHTKDNSTLLKKIELIKNGAIDSNENKMFLIKTNSKNKIKKHKIITLYYKINDKYICLHDNNIYYNNGLYYYNNLIEFKVLLPKISYYIQEEITILDSLIIFDKIFNKQISLEQIYNNDKYDIKDYYIGTFLIYTGLLYKNKNIIPNSIYDYFKYILSKNSRIICSSNNTCKIKLNNNEEITGRCQYNHYECLFLKTETGLYNINNFQTIPFKNVTDNIYTNRTINNNYCNNIKPLTQEYSINLNDKISIRKALIKIKQHNQL